MHIFGFDHHKNADPWDKAPAWAIELRLMLSHILKDQEKNHMATQAQIDKLLADVAKLIDAGVAEIAAAVAAAQNQTADPAVDAADARIAAATDNLTAAADALKAGQPLPQPVTPSP